MQIDKDGFEYSEDKFDPEPVRRMLGLDGGKKIENLHEAERLRLADLLNRTGHINQNELRLMGMMIIRR
jgi:hypothetical protein